MDGSGESVRFFKGPIHSHSQAKRNWDLSWVTRDGAKRRVRARAHCSSALSVSTNVTSHDTSTTAWVPTPSGVWSAHYCHEEPWSAAATARPPPVPGPGRGSFLDWIIGVTWASCRMILAFLRGRYFVHSSHSQYAAAKTVKRRLSTETVAVQHYLLPSAALCLALLAD